MFRNKTDKWYHVHVNEQDIVCTAGHPFYVADLDTFVPVKDLTGEKYVGKGPQSRMWQSASAHEKEALSRYVTSVKWRPAESNHAAFLQEAQWMDAAGWGGKNNRGILLNLINSPGHRY